MIDLCSDALAGVGVETSRLAFPDEAAVLGAKADLAVWLPGVSGEWVTPDRRVVSARAHVAFAFGQMPDRRRLSKYDAIWVPDARLAEGSHLALRGLVSDLSVLGAKVPAQVAPQRSQERALRRLPDAPVVLLDARADFASDIERLVIQLGLVQQPVTRLLLTPHENAARERVRTLCERHGVDAYMVSGSEALVAALPAVDWVIGRPSWAELVLLAAHQVALSVVGPDAEATRSWLATLRNEGAVDHITGVLHLAAAMEQKLRDAGGISARGTMLKEHVVGDPRPFLLQMASVNPRIQLPMGAAAWTPVGPHATQQKVGTSAAVSAREAHESPLDQAQEMESALRDLRARMRAEQEGNP